MERMVSLWRAPTRQKSNPEQEVVDGFDLQEYPGAGVFFATFLPIAQDFQRCYENGLQEIRLPASVVQDLMDRGVLQPDVYYLEGQSWHVPQARLGEFNQAFRQSSGSGRYFLESSD